MLWALKRRRLGFVLMLALVFVVTAGAGLAWREYDDRWEGIRGRDIAGGFDFLGVYAEPAPKARKAAKLWVSVPLRRKSEFEVRVFEPHSGYVMVPKRRTFEPGGAFSWRRAQVLEPAGIETEQLYVFAHHGERNLYYPARLTTAPPPAGVTGYVFRFRSGGGVALEVTIAREDQDGRLVEVVKRRRDEDLGGILDVTWDGRGANGVPQPAGVYHLKLAGWVFLKTDEKKDIDIAFFHDPLAAR